MAILTAIAIGATLYSAWQQNESGKDAQDSANERSQLLNLQAEEVEARGLINRALFIGKGQQTLGTQESSFAKLGIDVSTGSPLLIAQLTANAIGDELVSMRRETEFEAMAIRNDATGALAAGKDVREAARIQSFGTILSGGAAIARARG